ncbi:hypothetical protein [Fodinibius sp.]|uniref:hypothetical protein n=1 Tax=Fodinibius sp. TaxID=1872440 RepID=UPI002ACD562D|nr:hypothetical protein [Fodinibius sp.]MDZ7659109.1 hypothetical protein [Fodinibius sp.]
MHLSTFFKNSIIFTLTLVLSFIGLLTACNDTGSSNKNIVEVTAVHEAEDNKHLFKMNTHKIPSGWTTFEFNNASGFDHFFLIWQVPMEGIEAAETADQTLLDYWFQSITEPFQMEFNPYIEDEIDFDTFTNNLVASISDKAPWFFDPGAKTMGGPGFTAAGMKSKTTVHLEPGEYIVECYVKNEDEIFHSYIGMLEHLQVTEEESGIKEPNPTSTLTISSTEGIQFDEQLNEGKHIFEIHFKDQQSYAHLQGHNVQLVKLSNNEDMELLDSLSTWMDWRQAGSLVNRAPKGAEFWGGTMEMTEGSTAYFHVNLLPGDYAWIAEVPDPAEHNMLKTFTIAEEGDSSN